MDKPWLGYLVIQNFVDCIVQSNREKQTRVQQEFEDLVPEVTDSTYFKRVQGRHTLLFVYAEWCALAECLSIPVLARFVFSVPYYLLLNTKVHR